MVAVKLVEKIARHEEMDRDALIKESLAAYLLGKKQSFLQEKFELLSRYNVTSVPALKNAIKNGKVAGHPAWEDLIEARNIDAEIREIESDLGRLQKN